MFYLDNTIYKLVTKFNLPPQGLTYQFLVHVVTGLNPNQVKMLSFMNVHVTHCCCLRYYSFYFGKTYI